MDGENEREQHGHSDKVGTGWPTGLARALSLVYVVKTIAAATRERAERVTRRSLPGLWGWG